MHTKAEISDVALPAEISDRACLVRLIPVPCVAANRVNYHAIPEATAFQILFEIRRPLLSVEFRVIAIHVRPSQVYCDAARLPGILCIGWGGRDYWARQRGNHQGGEEGCAASVHVGSVVAVC